MDDQRRLENYLREFEPRRPRELPAPALRGRRAAAGILTAALCAGAVWLAARKVTPTSFAAPLIPPTQEASFSARELTRLALDDPREFEEALAAVSKRVLPSFGNSSSTLRVLTKE